MSNTITIECKIVLVGGVNTGKTCMIKKFCYDTFDENLKEVTVGSEISSKEIPLNKNVNLRLNLWDTAGQEQYRTLNKIFYKNAKIVALIYDITNKKSLEELQTYWFKQIKSCCDSNAIIGIAGNKVDLFEDAEVTEQEGSDFARNCGDLLFMQTSAQSGVCIKDFFMELGKRFYERYKDGGFDDSLLDCANFDLKKNNSNNKNQKKKCC